MKYGSIGKRFLALFLDNFFVSLIGSGLVVLTNSWYVGFSTLFISAAYYILFEGSEWHATPGKRIMKLCVIDEYGKGIDYSKAAIRFFGRILSGLIFGIGYIIALFDDKSQSLHDKIAGTYVIDSEVVPAYNSTGHSIIGVTGELAGMRFPLTGNGVLIGRDGVACQIVLPKSKGVSRLHCFVSYNPSSGMFILADRNSTYGTYTGSGVRVTPQKNIALRSGERFYLGSKDNMFEVR
ncbi:MAG: RDD family protein [Ruminococcus sp.]|nr:RDD family protein [Candidatus Copronaster equi]